MAAALPDPSRASAWAAAGLLMLAAGAALAGEPVAFAASTEVPGAAEPSGSERSPEALLRSTTDGLLRALERVREPLGDAPQRARLVREHVEPHLDFGRISRYVLGRHWRSATVAQRERIREELARMVYRSFADLLAGSEPVEMEYVGSRPAGSDSTRVTVRGSLRAGGRQPLDVRFRLQASEANEWKVYDVVVEGVSLLATYRSTFDVEVRRGGVEALIDSLAQKNASVERL